MGARWIAGLGLSVVVGLFAGCGGGSGGLATDPGVRATPAAAASSVPLRATPMGVLVPLYAYPLVTSGSGAAQTTQPNPGWTELAAHAAVVPTLAVINPNNGPLPCTQPPSSGLTAFQQGIALLHAAGARVLGYVYTGYGQRDLSRVQQDVQTYAQCYAVDGIFFDEVASQAALAPYYAAAASSVRQSIASAGGQPPLVVINPGTYPALSIAQTADITVVHESSDLNLAAPPAASLDGYAANRYAYLALGIDNLPQLQQVTLNRLFQQGVGYVDLTDQGVGGADPWARLSSFYADMIQSIQKLNQSLN